MYSSTMYSSTYWFSKLKIIRYHNDIPTTNDFYQEMEASTTSKKRVIIGSSNIDRFYNVDDYPNFTP